MKILKEGRKQRGWSEEVACSGHNNGGGGCRALLLVEQDDVFETSNHSYDGSVEHFATFRCPSCGVWTDLTARPPFDPRKRTPSRDGHASGEPLPPEENR